MIVNITRKVFIGNHLEHIGQTISISCEQIDLDLVIIPKLRKLLYLYNKHNSLININKRTIFVIKKINKLSLNDYINQLDNDIQNATELYNKYIINCNKDMVQQNKKYNRPLATGLLKLLRKLPSFPATKNDISSELIISE